MRVGECTLLAHLAIQHHLGERGSESRVKLALALQIPRVQIGFLRMTGDPYETVVAINRVILRCPYLFAKRPFSCKLLAHQQLLNVRDLHDAPLRLGIDCVLHNGYVKLLLAVAERDVCGARARGNLKYV